MFFENWKLEKIFLFMALVVGVLLIVITPPMCTPDENAHYMNAYSISRVDLFPEVVDGQVGRYVPKKILDFKDKYTHKVDGKLEEKYTFTEYYYDSWLIGAHTEDVFYATELTLISPIGYMFSAMGMAIGSFLLGGIDKFATPYNLLLFGRIFNLAFYITGVYFAIKTTPYFKKTMMVISLMPMSLYLGASISYDAILIPTSMMLFSIGLKLICSPKNYVIHKPDIMLVFISTFFLVGIKQAYAPFLLILFAIPIIKFGDKKRYISLIAKTLIVGIVAYFPTILMKIITSDFINPYISSQILQKEFLLNNIIMIPYIIVNTFRTFAMFYIPGFFGKLGQIDTNFPLPVIALFYLALFLIVLVDACDSIKINWKARFLPIISGIISILGIMLVMYIDWTSRPEIVGIGVDYISGVQGRYFIPMFLFLCMPIMNDLISKIKWRDKVIACSDNIAKITIVCCGVLTIFTVYTRFW